MSSKNSISVGKYNITKQIGKGSFAKVYKAYHKDTKELVAIKAVDLKKLNKKLLESLETEIAILFKINHPHIIRLYDTIKSENYRYLIMEFSDKGDLHEYIKKHGKIPEITVKKFFIQIASGLHFLWCNNFIHRDLKPQNILINEKGVLKICDFGFAKYIEKDAMMETLCGTPLYLAPEVLRFERYNNKVDLWSAGAILFQMMTGNPPYTANNHIELLKNIETTRLKIPRHVEISEECISLLKVLLVVKPDSRVTFEEFFKHPFFNGFKFDSKPLLETIEEDELPLDDDKFDRIEFTPATQTKSIYIKKQNPLHENSITLSPTSPYFLEENDEYVLVSNKTMGTSPPLFNSSKNISRILIIEAPQDITKIKIYIDCIELSASEVAYLGQRYQEDNYMSTQNVLYALCLYTKALHLFEHAITVCRNTMKEYLEYKSFLQPSLTSLSIKFTKYLQKSEKINVYILSLNIKCEVISAEYIIYYSALDMIRFACAEEMLGSDENALKRYVWSIRLLESLTMDEKPLNDHDIKIVDGFISKVNARVDNIIKINGDKIFKFDR